MRNILVLGASGMAGHVIYTYLKESKIYNILGTVNNNLLDGKVIKLNIYDVVKLQEVIDSFKPELVINCVGILIKGSNSFPDNAIYTNSYFPHYLAKLGAKKQFKVIHISTDCVFSGKTGKYSENSLKDAIDLYGMSKSLGEINDNVNLTIRTSIIGPEIKHTGEGLFHWFINQQNKIYGFKNNFWSGVTTLELASFIDWAINSNLTGLFHLTNNLRISKFDLLQLMSKVYKKAIIISDEKDYVSDKSFINTNTAVVFKVNEYEKMLENQLDFMQNHKSYYNHYKLDINEKF